MGYVSYLEDMQERLYDDLSKLREDLYKIGAVDAAGMANGQAALLRRVQAISQSTEAMLKETRQWLELLTSSDDLEDVNPHVELRNLRIRLQEAQDRNKKLQQRLGQEAGQRANLKRKLSERETATEQLNQRCTELEFALKRRDAEIQDLTAKWQQAKDQLEFQTAMYDMVQDGIPKKYRK